MRFDKKIDILQKVKLQDGIGGYKHDYEFQQSVLANVSPLKREISKEIFGQVSLTAINVVINKELELDEIRECLFVYKNKKYSDIESRVHRHKTYLFLEVLGNES